MSNTDTRLREVLSRFDERRLYRDLDTKALDISRSASAGNLGEGDYAEWALINDDPLVVVNYVKSYVTTLTSKLSASPFKPADDHLNIIGESLGLNNIFNNIYTRVFNDGYDYLGIGMSNGMPQVRNIDARYILFNGDHPTLKDATDVVIFEITPLTNDELKDYTRGDFPSGYVEFNEDTEKVITSHYYKDVDGSFKLDIYNTYDGEPETYELEGLDRIPVVRFVGDEVELSDKRYHYRGLYHMLGGVLKALTLTGTKIQIRTASSDDDNWIVSKQAIANYPESWRNCGAKEIDTIDGNNMEIRDPITPIQHDNSFLLNAFTNWKSVISDMLGPVVQSGSEAVTREEVIARNEVRDSLANTYLGRMSESISEVYRIIQMFMGLGNDRVVIVGGFIEAAKRAKYKQELSEVYTVAKESGLNVQGIATKLLEFTELPREVKDELAQTFTQDPHASPVVVELKGAIQQLENTINEKDQAIALLRVQATQRLERQAEYVAMQERVKRAELALKQWQQEQKDTQEARMALLKSAIESGDLASALEIVGTIEKVDPLLTTTPVVNADMNKNNQNYTAEASQAIEKATQGEIP